MGGLWRHLSEATHSLRSTFRNPGLRRVELAYAGSALGLYANAVAVAVYAYHHGGATAVGLVLFVRLGVASVAAPFVSSLADRYRQDRVMLTSDVARIATVAGTAIAAAGGASIGVYVLATLTSVLGTVFRPAEASLIPVLARTPEELTAANVASSLFDSVGAFVGPAAGALLLALGGPTAAFAAVAVAYAWSATFVARIHAPARVRPAEDGAEEHAGLAAGLRAVKGEPRLQLLLGLYGAQTLVAGAYGVLVVVVSLQLLDIGNAGVGYLQSATGVGAIVGGALALSLVARQRTAFDLALGLTLFGAPLLLLGALPRTWTALVLFVVLGTGNSLVDISAVTLLQRTAPPAVAGRVFGLLESTLIGALALGSLAAPVLVSLIGVRGALVAAGAVLPVVSALALRTLRALDAGAAVPDEQLAAIRSVPFLDALPLQRQEALAAALERVRLDAGTVLFSQGDAGDRFYILASGTLEIDLPDGVKVERAPSFVGEIALLSNVGRTATVRAPEEAELWALDGRAFVDGVAGHTAARAGAEAVLASRGAVFAV